MTSLVTLSVLLTVAASAHASPNPTPAPAVVFRTRSEKPTAESNDQNPSELQLLVPVAAGSEEGGEGADAGGAGGADMKARMSSMETSSEEERALVEALGLLLGTLNARDIIGYKRPRVNMESRGNFGDAAADNDEYSVPSSLKIKSGVSDASSPSGPSSSSQAQGPERSGQGEAPALGERYSPRLCLVDLSNRRDLPSDDSDQLELE